MSNSSVFDPGWLFANTIMVLFIFFAYDYIFFKYENATVILNDCSSNCVIEGTLKKSGLTGNHYIVDENGKVIDFDIKKTKSISIYSKETVEKNKEENNYIVVPQELDEPSK